MAMRRAVGYGVAFALGLAIFWGIQKLVTRSETSTAERGPSSKRDGVLVSRDATEHDPEAAPQTPEAAPQSAAAAVAKPPPLRPRLWTAETAVARTEPLPDAPVSRPGRDDASALPSVHETVELANAAFQRGDAETGARYLRGIFAEAKGRADVDLVPQVLKLLEVERDVLARKELMSYLAERQASGRALELVLSRAKALMASKEPAQAQDAWSELSSAYEAASGHIERQRVMSVLEPFLDSQVFSGRFSSLVETCTVKQGDFLGKIASRFQTTTDAIVRLNRLSSEVIQPRLRLRVIPGEAKVYVDKSDFRLWLTVGDRVLLARSVGLGKDDSTPVGSFKIRVRQKDPTWFRPGSAPIPAGQPGNILGSRWLGFEDTEQFNGFGIHGTDDPSSIGKESSAGCVRLLNKDIELLYDFVPRGTVVTIRN
jgi:LysM repeat protein